MARKSKQLEQLEQDRVGRAYLTGFMVGYALGQNEATRDLRMVRNDLETRFEDVTDNLRAEVGRLIAQIRTEWGLPEFQDPNKRPETMQ